MTKKYSVPVKIVFKGTVEVEANGRVEARNVVLENFWATMGNCGDNCKQQIKD